MLRGQLPGIVLTVAPTPRHAINIEVGHGMGHNRTHLARGASGGVPVPNGTSGRRGWPPNLGAGGHPTFITVSGHQFGDSPDRPRTGTEKDEEKLSDSARSGCLLVKCKICRMRNCFEVRPAAVGGGLY